MPTYSMENSKAKSVLVVTGSNNTVDSNTIVMNCGDVEMLRITPQGFWVRGKLVDQDDKEAQAVYNSFKQWLIASALVKP